MIKNLSKINLLENLHIEIKDLKLTKFEKEKVLGIYPGLEITKENNYLNIHMNDYEELEDKEKLYGIKSKFFSNEEISSEDSGDLLF